MTNRPQTTIQYRIENTPWWWPILAAAPFQLIKIDMVGKRHLVRRAWSLDLLERVGSLLQYMDNRNG